MKYSLKLFAAAGILALVASCSSPKQSSTAEKDFPKIDQKGKIAIVAHRGFWKCEAAGNSQNSIAALKAAQDAGFWGCELDIQLTSDDVVIVNHDNDIEGKRIWTNPYSTFTSHRLPNGETVPTLDSYLSQAEKCKTTMLICEFKGNLNDEREDVLVEKAVEIFKAHKLFRPDRVAFISFSRHVCDVVAQKYPQFINQYLTGKEIDPLVEEGINGIDYHYTVFYAHPDWCDKAHSYGMSVNAWTVDKVNDIQKCIAFGPDAITTNEPLLVRDLLKDKEFSLK